MTLPALTRTARTTAPALTRTYFTTNERKSFAEEYSSKPAYQRCFWDWLPPHRSIWDRLTQNVGYMSFEGVRFEGKLIPGRIVCEC